MGSRAFGGGRQDREGEPGRLEGVWPGGGHCQGTIFKVEIQEWVGGPRGGRKALDLASGQGGRVTEPPPDGPCAKSDTEGSGGGAGWRSAGQRRAEIRARLSAGLPLEDPSGREEEASSWVGAGSKKTAPSVPYHHYSVRTT